MTQKHTPGPWVVNNNHSGKTVRVESDADGYPNDGWVVVSEMGGPDAQANAALIAAAPDLLEALKNTYAYLWESKYSSTDSVQNARIKEVRDMVDAAISKAEGK